MATLLSREIEGERGLYLGGKPEIVLRGHILISWVKYAETAERKSGEWRYK